MSVAIRQRRLAYSAFTRSSTVDTKFNVGQANNVDLPTVVQDRL